MTESIVVIPDILKNILHVEQFYTSVGQITTSDQYVFDMSAVAFIKPYGVIALINLARHFFEISKSPVRIVGLSHDIHAYFNRLNLFEVCSSWLQSPAVMDEQWLRNPQTSNLLEVTPITGEDDVTAIVARAARIFSRWLVGSDLNSLLSVLSEICANVYQHSQDPHGFVLIQKYEAQTKKQVIIQVAVGDRGCGVRKSLASRHNNIGESVLDFLKAAMQGLSARDTGRGGLGLRRVEQIVKANQGYLWLRSETAAIKTSGPKEIQFYENFSFVPGVQIAVELCAPLPA